MKIEAIFFDQDNTLIKTKEAAQFAYDKTLKFLSEKLNVNYIKLKNEWKRQLDYIKSSIDPQKRYLDYSLLATLNSLKLNSNFIDEALSVYYEQLERLIELNEGVKEFFNKPRSFHSVLTTEDNKKQSDIKLSKFSLKSKFNLIVTSDTVKRMKPDIKYFSYAWERLKLNPGKCIYLGDNWEKDCKFGQEAGGIGVVYGIDKRANYQISNFEELEKILGSVMGFE